MIIKENCVFEIKLTLQLVEKYYLVCEMYDILRLSHKFNSIVIKKKEQINGPMIIEFIELKNKKSYDRLTANNEFHIITDTIDVYSDF